MPTTKELYFARFEPAIFALICEGAVLAYKHARMIGIEEGLIWAALRSIERGEASCAAFEGVLAKTVEEDFVELFRPLAEVLRASVTPGRVEAMYGRNLLPVFPPTIRPMDRPLDFHQPVTVGVLISELMAKFEYRHATNITFQKMKRDIPGICASLLTPEGFVVGPVLSDRGMVPAGKRELYERACAKAAFVGTWLVRDFHLAAAAEDLGVLNQLSTNGDILLRQWHEQIGEVGDRLGGEGCIPYLSFPGARPWLPSACKLLGVNSMVDNIFEVPHLHPRVSYS